MSDSPSRPFEVLYTAAKPGQVQQPAKWSVPFDTSYRDVELPDAEVNAFAAYSSIGWHVVQNAMAYVPAYKVAGVLSLRFTTAKAQIDDWAARTVHGLTITDRRNGTVYHLLSSVSDFEAATSWFCREHGHDKTVLCLDRKDKTWYIEETRPDFTIALNDTGQEVALSDPHEHESYMITMHPNAVMVYGE